MELIKQIVSYLYLNGPQLVALIAALMTFLGLLTRLTPTKTDDQFFERIDKFLQRLFDVLNIPNYKAGGGTHPKLVEYEQTKTAALESYKSGEEKK